MLNGRLLRHQQVCVCVCVHCVSTCVCVCLRAVCLRAVRLRAVCPLKSPRLYVSSLFVETQPGSRSCLQSLWDRNPEFHCACACALHVLTALIVACACTMCVCACPSTFVSADCGADKKKKKKTPVPPEENSEHSNCLCQPVSKRMHCFECRPVQMQNTSLKF